MDGHSFLDDVDKMYDFKRMSRKEFLEFYSYLSDDDYEVTCKQLRSLLKFPEQTMFFDKNDNPVVIGDIVCSGSELHIVGHIRDFVFTTVNECRCGTPYEFYFHEVEKVFNREEE